MNDNKKTLLWKKQYIKRILRGKLGCQFITFDCFSIYYVERILCQYIYPFGKASLNISELNLLNYSEFWNCETKYDDMEFQEQFLNPYLYNVRLMYM
jgi:hypothetical protein